MNSIMISKVKGILTPQQFKILKMFLNGDTYEHMANANNTTIKKIDNTIQAIKRKLRTIKGEIQ